MKTENNGNDMLFSSLYEYIGRAHIRLNEDLEAETALKTSLQYNQDNSVAGHMLASLLHTKGSDIQALRAPDAYVSKLFDDFSETFEDTLASLSYKAPVLLAQSLIRQSNGVKFSCVLDLGSGTGLFGDEVRRANMTDVLIGVDLSVKMLHISESKGAYDYLFVGEINEFLRGVLPACLTSLFCPALHNHVLFYHSFSVL